MTNPNRALAFRQTDTQYILLKWSRGESCALVGTGSIGKSNLFQHLLRADVRQHYLGDQSAKLIPLAIDPFLIGAFPEAASAAYKCWAGYELILHRLYIALHPFPNLPQEDAERIYHLYRTMHDGTNPLFAPMGLRYLEMALDILTRNGYSIVLLLDEFEQMLLELPLKFFQSLRGLRDAYKYRLSFTTFARRTLPELAGAYLQELEPFIELFTDNTLFLGPYSNQDAVAMASSLLSPTWKNDASVDLLLYLTGGFAGLLRASAKALQPLAPMRNHEVFQFLLENAGVRAECATILRSLDEQEQAFLRRVSLSSEQVQSNSAIVLALRQRSLLSESGVHPPMLEAYLKTV